MGVLSFISVVVMTILPKSNIGEERVWVHLDLFSCVMVHYCREVKAGAWYHSHSQKQREATCMHGLFVCLMVLLYCLGFLV